jgi:hypothetical protein
MWWVLGIIALIILLLEAALFDVDDETGQYGYSVVNGLTIAVFLAIYWYLGGFDLAALSAIKQQAWFWLGGVIVYVVIGVGYGVTKWWLYVKKCAWAWEERYARYEQKFGKPPWTESQLKEFKQPYSRTPAFQPEPTNNKGRIINWISFWPWSLALTLLRDPFRFLYEFIFNEIVSLLKSISEHAFRDISDKLADDEKK